MRNVTTTTISLPKAMARRARRLARKEDSTMSELFREAFREYEKRQNTRPRTRMLNQGRKVNWGKLQANLKEISRSGRQNVNLTEFLIRDRLSH